jgi:hypothetical protein
MVLSFNNRILLAFPEKERQNSQRFQEWGAVGSTIRISGDMAGSPQRQDKPVVCIVQ